VPFIGHRELLLAHGRSFAAVQQDTVESHCSWRAPDWTLLANDNSR
jgi:hypothetical protein